MTDEAILEMVITGYFVFRFTKWGVQINGDTTLGRFAKSFMFVTAVALGAILASQF